MQVIYEKMVVDGVLAMVSRVYKKRNRYLFFIDLPVTVVYNSYCDKSIVF